MQMRGYTLLLLCFLFAFVNKLQAQITSKGLQTIEISKGSSVSLQASSSGASSYLWFKDGVLIKDYNNYFLITATPGVYKVASINSGGCTSDLSDEIKVILKQIQADLSITKRSDIKPVKVNETFQYYLDVRNNGINDATLVKVKDALPDDLSFVSMIAPNDGVATYDASSRTINWNIDYLANGQFAELVITVKSTQPGIIRNTASVSAEEYDPNVQNNKSTDSKEISGIRIPNVFTPNGDGKNDTFFIENLDQFESNEVTIINRWGSTVYQSNSYLNDWTANGLSDGTYYYVVKVRNGNSKWLEYKGYVTVIR